MENLAKADWDDPQRVKGLIDSYTERYGEVFWSALLHVLGSRRRDTVVELGCGPGLFLVDAVGRLGSSFVYGLDASQEMLARARDFLRQVLPEDRFRLVRVDFDTESISVGSPGADLCFAGYLLHEVANPVGLLTQTAALLRPEGACAVFDFVSGDEEGFVKAMVGRGVSEEHARRRYPHMCKHSLEDLTDVFSRSGYASISHVLADGFRAIVVGVRSRSQRVEASSVSNTHSSRRSSPWAHDDSEVKCPSCQSTKVFRVLDRWALSRGVQVFQCTSCGRKFYERGVDDYQPTF
ncbi:MAG: methyltransferase domain-containing protein [Candidatus Thorarchaeota archaeon]|nr:methyltransferase domain-containing protein [Candidatus Thorarchaeota archaeon]